MAHPVTLRTGRARSGAVVAGLVLVLTGFAATPAAIAGSPVPRPAQTTDPGGDQLLPPTAPSRVITQAPVPVPDGSVPAAGEPTAVRTPAPAPAEQVPAPGPAPTEKAPAPTEKAPAPTEKAPSGKVPAPGVAPGAPGDGAGVLGALVVVLAAALTAGLCVALVPMARSLSVLRGAVIVGRRGPAAADAPRSDLTFSLLVPARTSAPELSATLHSLVQLDHPVFEVLAVVDDDATRTAAPRGCRPAIRASSGSSTPPAAGDDGAGDQDGVPGGGCCASAQGDIVATFEPGDRRAPRTADRGIARRMDADGPIRARARPRVSRSTSARTGGRCTSPSRSCSVSTCRLAHHAAVDRAGHRAGRVSTFVRGGRAASWDATSDLRAPARTSTRAAGRHRAAHGDIPGRGARPLSRDEVDRAGAPARTVPAWDCSRPGRVTAARHQPCGPGTCGGARPHTGPARPRPWRGYVLGLDRV